MPDRRRGVYGVFDLDVPVGAGTAAQDHVVHVAGVWLFDGDRGHVAVWAQSLKCFVPGH